MSTHYCNGTITRDDEEEIVIAFLSIDSTQCHALIPDKKSKKWFSYRLFLDEIPPKYENIEDVAIGNGNNSRFTSMIRTNEAARAMTQFTNSSSYLGHASDEWLKILAQICRNIPGRAFIVRPTAITSTRQIINLREISIATIINKFYPEVDQFSGLFACKFVKMAPTWLSGDEVERNVIMMEVRHPNFVVNMSKLDRVYLALIGLTVLHSARVIHGNPEKDSIVFASGRDPRKDVLTWKSCEKAERFYVYCVLQNYRQSFVDIEVDMLEKYVPDNPTFQAACLKDMQTLLRAMNAPAAMLAYECDDIILPTLQILEHFYPRIKLE